MTERQDGDSSPHLDSEISEPLAADSGDVSSRDPYFREREKVLAVGWSRDYYGSLHVPLGAIPRTWPQLLHYAVGHLYPNGEYSDGEYLTRFEALFGPCAMTNLVDLGGLYLIMRDDPSLAADAEKVGSERLFVLLMLGVWPEHPSAEHTRGILGEFLSSSDLLERMVSAISLSHLRDERAIPALLSLLTDGLPIPEPWEVEIEMQAQERWKQFEYAAFHAHMPFRQEIPPILARWEVRSAIPALRQALDWTARIERTEARWDPRPHRRWAQDWQAYQSLLVGALARLGDLGALIGIEPPEDEGVDRGAGHASSAHKEAGTSRPDDRTKRYRWRIATCLELVAQRFERSEERRVGK